jgi:serine/threonine protein phosphatase PrpC
MAGEVAASSAGEEGGGAAAKTSAELAVLQAEVIQGMNKAKTEGLSKTEALEVMMKLMMLQKSRAEGAGGAGPGGAGPSAGPHAGDDGLVNAGCTSVVALIRGREMWVANAGDSRGVMCRAGTAVPLSFDHKPQDKVELDRIQAAGGFVTEQGRVNGNLNLSRCIGDLKYKVDESIPASAQIITAEPDVLKFAITDEDEFIILGCDGIWDCKTNQEAVDFVRPRLRAGQPKEAIIEELLDAIITKDPQATGGIGADNMTCMIVELSSKGR